MLNENLKKARINKGISQEQLAVQLNMVRQTVSKWEKGTSVPDAETLVRLSEILEVPVNALLGDLPAADPLVQTDIAQQLAQLNHLIATKLQRDKEIWSILKKAAIVIIALSFLAAILPHWNATWRDFGRNLYHLLNPGS